MRASDGRDDGCIALGKKANSTIVQGGRYTRDYSLRRRRMQPLSYTVKPFGKLVYELHKYQCLGTRCHLLGSIQCTLGV